MSHFVKRCKKYKMSLKQMKWLCLREMRMNEKKSPSYTILTSLGETLKRVMLSCRVMVSCKVGFQKLALSCAWAAILLYVAGIYRTLPVLQLSSELQQLLSPPPLSMVSLCQSRNCE